MAEKEMNNYFTSLVMMFATACWQHLGKVPNPMTNKAECDLQNAQFTIDILSMLAEKTKGNLTPEEEKLLTNTISDLQLNYADEVNKPKPAAAPVSTPAAEIKPEEKKENNEVKL